MESFRRVCSEYAGSTVSSSKMWRNGRGGGGASASRASQLAMDPPCLRKVAPFVCQGQIEGEAECARQPRKERRLYFRSPHIQLVADDDAPGELAVHAQEACYGFSYGMTRTGYQRQRSLVLHNGRTFRVRENPALPPPIWQDRPVRRLRGCFHGGIPLWKKRPPNQYQVLDAVTRRPSAAPRRGMELSFGQSVRQAIDLRLNCGCRLQAAGHLETIYWSWHFTSGCEEHAKKRSPGSESPAFSAQRWQLGTISQAAIARNCRKFLAAQVQLLNSRQRMQSARTRTCRGPPVPIAARLASRASTDGTSRVRTTTSGTRVV